MPTLPPEARLAHLIARWDLAVDETRETPTALFAFGRRGAVPVVLKLARAAGDEWHAGPIVRAFNGAGMVHALEIADGVILLERLTPGTPLATLSLAGRDDEATSILAEVIGRLSAAELPPACPTVEGWGGGFARYLTTRDRQIPRPLVKRAQARYLELAASQRDVRLLHGDLQHYNVLLDAHRGWVAIDPKGVDRGAGIRAGRESPEPGRAVGGLHLAEDHGSNAPAAVTPGSTIPFPRCIRCAVPEPPGSSFQRRACNVHPRP